MFRLVGLRDPCSGSISTAAPTFEGAGVHLHRAFGFSEPQAVICRGWVLKIADIKNESRLYFIS